MQRTVLLLQFCLSVCLSVRCVYCDKTKWWTADILIRVRPIPFWRPIPDTIGRSCTDTDTDTDTGNDITYSLGQTYLTYVAHTVCMFQNITPLTLRFETFETNYRLETIGVLATVLTVEAGKWTIGIGTDTKISIARYPIPVSV